MRSAAACCIEGMTCVGVEGEGDRRVPESLGQDLRVLARRKRERRVGVPKDVEPDRRQACSPSVTPERLEHVIRVQRAPVLAAEDEIVVLVVGTHERALGDLHVLAVRSSACSRTSAELDDQRLCQRPASRTPKRGDTAAGLRVCRR